MNSETRGLVSADNWSLQGEASSTSGAFVAGRAGGVSLGVGLTEDAWSGLRMSLVLLLAGSCALLLPILLHSVVYHAPTLRTALETMMTMLALTAASMFRGQFASSRRLSDLLLFGTALMMGLLALCIGALPAALDLRASTHFAAAGLCSQLLVGAMFAAAALASTDRLVVGARHPVLATAALSVAAVATAALGGILIHAQVVGDKGSVVQVLGHSVGLTIVLAATALLALAATSFARRYRPGRTDEAGPLAAAALLLAAAGFYQLAPGSLPPGQIGPGQVLMAAAFGLILIVAVRRDFHARARMARAGALAERRRVARDLHDGLAQDLALIAVHGELIAQDMGDEHPMVVAARRALSLSRSTISELSDPAGATAEEALEAVAQECRERFDVAITVEADCDRELASGAQEQVSRIAREAIANAARHGRAKHVVVSLRRADTGVTLRVVDDGCGFSAEDLRRRQLNGHVGLSLLQERVAEAGATIAIISAPGSGTSIRLQLAKS